MVRMDCWRHELETAASEAEVMKCATDYLRLWAPRGMTPVSIGLDELKIRSTSDIEVVKRRLSDAPPFSDAGTREGAHVRELADYFWRAAARIGELRGGRSRVAR
jgi:hypothetical protein